MYKSQDEISDWMSDYIGKLIGTPENEIDRDAKFSTLGLQSSSLISMTGELSYWMGTEIEPTVAYEYSTINTMAQNIVPEEMVENMEILKEQA